MFQGEGPVQTGTESLSSEQLSTETQYTPYRPNAARNRREWLNTLIEIALLWLAVILVIACWR